MYTYIYDIVGAPVMIRRDSDGHVFPIDQDNPDYKEFEATGETPKPDPSWGDIVKQKRLKRDLINAECERRIFTRWPLPVQTSINAGLYPLLTAQRDIDVATLVEESNAARDVVFAMTDINLVRAYDPVTGPGWTDIGVYTKTEPI